MSNKKTTDANERRNLIRRLCLIKDDLSAAVQSAEDLKKLPGKVTTELAFLESKARTVRVYLATLAKRNA